MTFSVLQYLASPFTDPNAKKSGDGRSILPLDGIRGLAAVTVIASHTDAFGMTGQGSLGVLLFFALSGFLLSGPFVKNPDRIFRSGILWRFAANRFLRIVPAFVVALFWVKHYIPEEGWDWIVKHLFFLGGWNHFWSVASEARFYVLFPLVIAALSLTKSTYLRLLMLAIIGVVSYQHNMLVPVDMFDGNFVQFFFWFFVGGMFAGFAVPAIPKNNRVLESIFNSVALITVAALFLASDNMINALWRPLFSLPAGTTVNGWTFPAIWCALFALTLIAVTSFEGAVSRFFSSYLMRHFGLLSYGLYLFHIPVMIMERPLGFQQNGLFVATLSTTYVVALISYLAIEKPFLMLKPRSSNLERRTLKAQDVSCTNAGPGLN